MSREPSPLQNSQPSANRQGVIAPHLRHDESNSNLETVDRHSTVGTVKTLMSAQTAGTNPPSEGSASLLHTGTTSEKGLTVRAVEARFQELKQRHHDVPYTGDKTPRLPTRADFSPSILLQIVPERTEKDVEHIVIFLPHSGASESSLKKLALDLNKQQPETSFVLLRGLEEVPTPNGGYQWADSAGEWDEGFLEASEAILANVIKASLIVNCGFAPHDILLIGHGQGGMAAMATAALWDDVELGGVVSIGGPLPSYVQSDSTKRIKTPALAMGGGLGRLTNRALNCIKARFICVDTYICAGAHDTLLEDEESRRPLLERLLEFLAHRLRREEWDKQAVLSFDGGGIRGYGSLLILQELMNKIGNEERRLDDIEGKEEKTQSSFAPWPYKPIVPDSSHNPRSMASDVEDLPNSSLFLPCHYFDYAVGTSTGGLISIMLSRLRMTVDDCITEYESLGQKIFGNPRPFAYGAVLWHKFDHRVLKEVIRSVAERHGENSEEFELTFPSDEDLCRTLVMAYAEHNKTEAPYLFRTYYAPPPDGDQKKTKLRQTTARNHGLPPKLSIWEIGRATSAAPKYFPPIKIKVGMEHNAQGYVRFKDGGFGCNNPSEEAYYDIVHKHGDLSSTIGPFISIGTGIKPLELFAKRHGNLPNALANMRAAHKHPSRTLHVHDAMTRLSQRDRSDIFSYYRFDGGERLGKVELDEWKNHRFTSLTGRSTEPGYKTLEEMFVATAAYLQDRDVKRDLDECAKILVKRRRLRARDTSAWDRYASASFYECSYQGCQKSRINTAQAFEDT